MVDGTSWFCGLLVILPILQLGFERAECIRALDYDFIAADDLFANRSYVRGSYKSVPEKHMETPPIFTATDSPIGYEVPCGVRGGGTATSTNDLNMEQHRIVGGIKAHPGEFPWQVSLQLISGWFSRHICGGTILSSYWIITAGHCVANLKPQALVVVAGDHDLFRREGTEQRAYVVRIVNGGYSQDNFSTDIALLQLKTPLKLNDKYVSPICLPNPAKQYLPGEFGLVSGWGKLSEGGKLPHILHFVKLPIIAASHCHKLYDTINYGKYINKCQICCGYESGGSDSCQGDSGGPLVCQHSDKRYYLCGIVSWGVGCARPNLPGVYTEVPCYTNWIKSILYNVDNVVSAMPPY
ncbi:hypothetical protein RUM44_012658 [Polyplax serrata]|uniref:Peptidase S1 domain-containing protein n=1 Tax=Polyplax serrata TaxID=468196 RepID=A0ABR1BDZ9_POLSC